MARDQGALERATNGAVGGDLAGSVTSALKSKEFLVPAALSAAGAVAAAKGPDVMRRLSHDAEGKAESAAQSLGEKAGNGAKESIGKVIPGMGGAGGTKKTRRLSIQRWTDVAVPVEKAYGAWTKFDEFPKFMHRVLSVEQKGRDRLSWQEKIWFSKRQWEGRITDRRKNDRIAWKTTSGMSHKGVVSFHRLDDHLTRVMVTMEFEPNGMIEKMASGLRFVKRAVQADLARFKTYVELDDAKGIEYRAEDDDEQASNRNGSGQQSDDSQRESRRNHRRSQREERRKRAKS